MLGRVSRASRPVPQELARLFIGLLPDEPVRDALQRHVATWHWPPGAVPTRRGRLHLTLHFLGALPREAIAGLVQRLDLPFEPCELRLERAEVWRGEHAVICPQAVPPALATLHARLLRALAGPEASPSRWHPHVTLARHAKEAVPPAAPACIRWPVTGYALVESDLRPPASYRVVAAYP